MKTIGYGIVGTGYFGAELGRIMQEQEGAKIVAVLDPENGETIAQELGCAVETDLDALCARPDVDALIVATPNYLHKEPVLTAARHKKHVFCEKPIALRYADCDEMVRACQENGVTFMAGHVMNFFRSVRHAKQLIAEGKIGRVLYCHSARNGWEEPQPSISWKKIRAKSGGHLYHHIHELDCIQFLMGPAVEVTMTGGNVAHKGEQFGDEDDMLFLMLEFAEGTHAVVEYGSAFHWPEHYVLIQGTLGAIRIDMCNVGMTVKTADGSDEHYLCNETKEEGHPVRPPRQEAPPVAPRHHEERDEVLQRHHARGGSFGGVPPPAHRRGRPGGHCHRRRGHPLPAGGPKGQGV